MSIQFRIDDQVLKVADASDVAEAVVHKYDAFLNLLCYDRYAFQRDAVRGQIRDRPEWRYEWMNRIWNPRKQEARKKIGWRCRTKPSITSISPSLISRVPNEKSHTDVGRLISR